MISPLIYLFQQCIVLHTLDDSFNPTYKLGCADTSVSTYSLLIRYRSQDINLQNPRYN